MNYACLLHFSFTHDIHVFAFHTFNVYLFTTISSLYCFTWIKDNFRFVTYSPSILNSSFLQTSHLSTRIFQAMVREAGCFSIIGIEIVMPKQIVVFNETVVLNEMNTSVHRLCERAIACIHAYTYSRYKNEFCRFPSIFIKQNVWSKKK